MILKNLNKRCINLIKRFKYKKCNYKNPINNITPNINR